VEETTAIIIISDPIVMMLKTIDDEMKDHYYSLTVMGSILKVLPKKERKVAFNILWHGVIDKEKLNNKFVQDVLVSTEHEEYCLENVNRAKLLFRLTTFLLSLAATIVIAISSGLANTDIALTLTWIAFGLSLGSTFFKSLDSGALPLVAAYYQSQIKDKEDESNEIITKEGKKDQVDEVKKDPLSPDPQRKDPVSPDPQRKDPVSPDPQRKDPVSPDPQKKE